MAYPPRESQHHGYSGGSAAHASGHSSSNTPNFRWWIPAEGIRRDVIQADIQRYLGPEAVVRPGEGRDNDRGRSGYWIAAYRTLTPAMIQDLRADSANFERSGDRGAYENSMVHRSRQHWGPTEPQPIQQESRPVRTEPEPAGYSRGETAYSSNQQYAAPQQSYGGGYENPEYSRPSRQTVDPRYAQSSGSEYSSGYGTPSTQYSGQQVSPAAAYTHERAPQQGHVSQQQFGYAAEPYGRQSTQDYINPTPRQYQQSSHGQQHGASGYGSQPSSTSHGASIGRSAPPGYYLASDGKYYPESSKPSAT